MPLEIFFNCASRNNSIEAFLQCVMQIKLGYIIHNTDELWFIMINCTQSDLGNEKVHITNISPGNAKVIV